MSRHHEAAGRASLKQARALLAQTLPAPCHRCGGEVQPGDAWEADHDPPLALDPLAPCYVSHTKCNRLAGARLGNRIKRSNEAARQRGENVPDMRGGWAQRREPRDCEHCGCTFTPGSKGPGRYCSPDCAAAANTLPSYTITWAALCSVCRAPMSEHRSGKGPPPIDPPAPLRLTCGQACSTARNGIAARDAYRADSKGQGDRASKYAALSPVVWAVSSVEVEEVDTSCRHGVLRSDDDAIWQSGRFKNGNMRSRSLSSADEKPREASSGTRTRRDGATTQGNGAAGVPPVGVPSTLPEFDPNAYDAPWIAEILDRMPDSASMPLLMTAQHPKAVGSYGAQAAQWIQAEMGITLRWYQALAFARQLEHDESGALCWANVVDSTPRRVGKSVRLKATSLWRIAHAHLLGEQQTVMFTGKDLAICKEIHSSMWAWAAQRGWHVLRGVGTESIAADDGSRWLVRSQTGVYGYDVGMGVCDESWNVPDAVIRDGLRPALLDRMNPQLLLTSTAHARATTLMLREIAKAIACLDGSGDSLLLLWGARRDDDASDPLVWRQASPHWDEARAHATASAYTDAAMSGAVEVEGFRAQYLNVWPSGTQDTQPGERLFADEVWLGLRRPGLRPPSREAVEVVAVEDDFGRGGAVAVAWHDEAGEVCVRSAPMTLTDCWLQAEGARRVLCGRSLASSTGARRVGAEPVGTREATAGLSRLRELVEGGRLLWDGPDRLALEGSTVRVQQGAGNTITLRPRQDITSLRALLFAVGALVDSPPPAEMWVM